jgi:hypothetical protein
MALSRREWNFDRRAIIHKTRAFLNLITGRNRAGLRQASISTRSATVFARCFTEVAFSEPDCLVRL